MRNKGWGKRHKSGQDPEAKEPRKIWQDRGQA